MLHGLFTSVLTLSAVVVLSIRAIPAVGQDSATNSLEPATQAFDARAVELTLADKSVLNVILADELLEVLTSHGTLQIPTEDILSVEFAQRPSAEIAQLVEVTLAKLMDEDPHVRDRAGEELVAIGLPAYLPVFQATMAKDPMFAQQAAAVLERLKQTMPPNALATSRVTDLIVTPENKVAGRIANPYLRIHTSQFGELQLMLADARGLRHQSLIAKANATKRAVVALPDPGNLTAFESQRHQVLVFTVTGATTGGNVWGSDVYTSDSRLSIAAVHAGMLKDGETGVVRVMLMDPPPAFAGSSRHGVTTSAYGPYQGAYQFVILADE